MAKKIVIIDFGSQTCHLIGRRLRDLGIEVVIIDPEEAVEEVKRIKPAGIILSGGPASVYEKGVPTIDKQLFSLAIPILGICYGTQVITHLLGGEVKAGKVKEFGKVKIKITKKTRLLSGLEDKDFVWMSHGDVLGKLPKDFLVTALSEFKQIAVVENKKEKIFGFLFHPEVEHTAKGAKLLENFASKICGLKAKGKPSYRKVIKKLLADIKKEVGSKSVFLFASGGIDSTVAFILLNKSLGEKKVLGVHVDTGLLREGESQRFKETMESLGFKNFHIEKAADLFLSKLQGVSDPERKRKIIGSCYLEIQRKVLKRFNLNPRDWLLGQGTIYPDFITSGRGKYAENIKSHHNVGGLPGHKYRLIEPLKFFYKNEVRKMGEILGLPFEFVWKEPFPGPGIAVRILGPVDKEKLSIQRRADLSMGRILIKTGWFYKLWHRFPVVARVSEKERPVLAKNIVGKPSKKKIKTIKEAEKVIKQFLKEKKLKTITIKPILLPVKCCGIKGDARAYENPLALQIRGKKGWRSLSYDFLEELSTLLTNKIEGITRVVLDLTAKEKRGWDILIFYRIITSQETMTADWAKLQPPLLNKITTSVMKDKRVDKVFFDITQKPPGMMEWE